MTDNNQYDINTNNGSFTSVAETDEPQQDIVGTDLQGSNYCILEV